MKKPKNNYRKKKIPQGPSDASGTQNQKEKIPGDSDSTHPERGISRREEEKRRAGEAPHQIERISALESFS